MPTITLAESAKLCQDQLVAGVIETIVTVNPLFELLPFNNIDGNALSYNRELTMGDSQFLGVGGTITAKNAATHQTVSSSLTTLIGDAEVNGLIQATRSGINDQTAVQVASKAKSVARKFMDAMINGDGTGDSFQGLLALTPASQKVNTGPNGANLSFELLDELLDMVKDKDGNADYILMPRRSIRTYKSLLRALGGATIDEVHTLPSGSRIMTYNGVPILPNDFIPVNQSAGSSSGTTTIFAGTFDDGSEKMGISGLTAKNSAGISVKRIGEKENADEVITRVKFYCGMANFSQLGIAALPGIKN